MDGNPAYWHRRLNGTVEIEELPCLKWGSLPHGGAIVQQFLYTWRLPYQLVEELPKGFSLSLECGVDKSGIRHFAPSKLTTIFIREASLGGHAILIDRDGIKKGLPLWFDEFRLFNQYICHRREYFGSTTKLEQALYVASAGRDDRGTPHILPADLGLDAKGGGCPWNVPTLRREGLAAAWAAGIANPTPAEVLRCGCLASAQRNPLFVRNTKEARALMRMTLFALSPGEGKPAPSAIALVAKHVRAALKNFKVTEDAAKATTEDFNCWAEDKKANLIHQIAKRSDCALGRDGVRSALLELGWLSFETIGRCIDTQMRAFRDALPNPLNRTEDSLFDQLFFANHAFGNLPGVLLYDRFDFLKEALLETWQRPKSQRDIAIVHRMMSYYATLVGNRRTGYREYKKHTNPQANNKLNRAKDTIPFSSGENRTVDHQLSCRGDRTKNRRAKTARIESLPRDLPNKIAKPSPALEQFERIAIRLARARGSSCDFYATDLQVGPVEVNEDKIGFFIASPSQGFDETWHVSRAEFDAAREQLAEE